VLAPRPGTGPDELDGRTGDIDWRRASCWPARRVRPPGGRCGTLGGSAGTLASHASPFARASWGT